MKHEIKITPECYAFIAEQPQRVLDKFYEVIAVLVGIRVVGAPYVKKLTNTRFYELRVKAGQEYRFILYPLDNENFTLAKKVICLNGFVKKSTKDYRKAVSRGNELLKIYAGNERTDQPK